VTDAQRFQAMIEFSSDMIGLHDRDGRITYLSPSITRLLGYRPEGLVGHSMLNLVHPDDQERIAGLFEQLVHAPGARITAEYRLRHADGSWRWIEGTGTNLLDEPGVQAVVVNFHDITKLKESETRYKLLASAAFEGLVVHQDGKHVDVNEAFASLFGYDRAELIGLSPWALAAPESRATIQERSQSGSEEPYEAVGLRKDGSRLDLEIRGRTPNDGGRSLRVVAVRDITERKRADAALREKEAQYRGIFEATSDGLDVIDLESGVVVEANPAVCRMLGYTYPELIGRHASTFIHPDDLPLFKEYLATIRSGGEFRRRVRNVRRDGSVFLAEVIGKSFVYQGRPHALGIVRDITEQVETERVLEERVQARTRELSALYRADETLLRSLRLDDILQALVHEATEILGADKTTVLVWDVTHTRLVPGAAHGFAPETLARMSHGPGQGITWRVAESGRPIAVEDAQADPRVTHAITEPERIRSLLHVPITVGGEVFGVFGVNYCQPRRFTGEEQRLLVGLAQRAALAINNARLYEQAEGKAALEERQKLARELHDSVSQALYGIGLGARTARTLLDRNPSALAEPLDYVLGLSEAALAEMRALIFELRPESLEQEGLVAALEKHAASLRARYGLVVDFRSGDGDEPDVPLATKEALYRVAQEALHNVTKHARASQVQLRLACQDGCLVLEVQDNGAGFDPSGSFPGHLGLQSMRERTERLGGSLHIASDVGQGTRVCARVPLRR
jgi:PAS domain S-box-containing protein